jgi:hypothetical protein
VRGGMQCAAVRPTYLYNLAVTMMHVVLLAMLPTSCRLWEQLDCIFCRMGA